MARSKRTTAKAGQKEGALMAKRVAKRETNAERGGYKEFRCNGFTVMVPRSVSKVWGKNAERRLREDVHRIVVRHARTFAGAIRALMKDKSPLAPKEMENLPAKKLKRVGYHPKSKMVREYYADLVEFFWFFHGDVPEFLRLVVKILEGKPPLPGPYDDKIKAAYEKAMSPVRVLPNGKLVGGGAFLS